jgi:hypothetical protein
MRWSLLAALSASPLALSALAAFGAAPPADAIRVSGPVTHANLTVYFVHGPSASGPVPLTLEEALAARVVEVRETGSVNQLEIENLGNDEVFIQSGDIVKGGRQDRALMVSLVLPPKSGRVPIAAFCVEEGRWSARGQEDVKNFSSAAGQVPSREMKIAMKAPKAAPALGPAQDPRRTPYASETSARQSEVWSGVRKMQGRLTDSVGARINSARSPSSLQLALENDNLLALKRAYVDALKAKGEAEDDIIGYVFAVNGKLNSADLYPSNGLFRKMWAKLLNASATEAIVHKDEARGAEPSIEAVTAFLADAERGKATEKPLTAGLKLDSREGDQAYYFETARASGWVHRNYLAK